MNQEIKQKLKQAAETAWEQDQKTNPTPVNPHAYVYGYKAGAQTILEDPGEWGLCQKDDVAKERTKWAKAYSHNDNEKNSALMHQVNEIEELQSQLTKYREVLERILQGNCSPTIIAKEALKQEVNNDL